MKYHNLTLGQIEAIVNKLGGMEGVKLLLSGKLTVVEPFQRERTCKIKIDRLQGVEEMIAKGKYEEVARDIYQFRFNESLPELNARLFTFNAQVRTSEAIRIMALLGWLPARFEHLLALGAMYPDLDLGDAPVIALGSIEKCGEDIAPAIFYHWGFTRTNHPKPWRQLYVATCDEHWAWDRGAHFLAIEA